MIDRVVHHADVIALKGAPYRLRDCGVETLPSIKAELGHGWQPRLHAESWVNSVIKRDIRNWCPLVGRTMEALRL